MQKVIPKIPNYLSIQSSDKTFHSFEPSRSKTFSLSVFAHFHKQRNEVIMIEKIALVCFTLAIFVRVTH